MNSRTSSPEQPTDQHSLCFETLANELRLRIVRLLEKEELNVTSLAEQTGAERSRVSHALQALRECRLVAARKRGREVVYTLNKGSPVFNEHKGNLFSILEEHARMSCARCAKSGRAPAFHKA